MAISGQVDEARVEMSLYNEAASLVPPTYTLHNNTCTALLQVASAMLLGEIEYRAGNVDIAFSSLRQAVSLSDELNYDEPWGWMQPPRHALGALLMEQVTSGLRNFVFYNYNILVKYRVILKKPNQYFERIWM